MKKRRIWISTVDLKPCSTTLLKRLRGFMTILLFTSMFAVAPNTRALEQPPNASEMDTAVGSLQEETHSIAQQMTDFSGFGTTFSPLGAPRNVIVLRRNYNNGRTQYRVRVFYENDSESVVVDGVSQVYRYIVITNLTQVATYWNSMGFFALMRAKTR